MSGRFPLTAVPVINDPFCADSFCDDTNIGGGADCGAGAVPTAVIWTVTVRSILAAIEGKLLPASCLPPGPNPTLPSIIRAPIGGTGSHTFRNLDSPLGSYGFMDILPSGDFKYIVDLTNGAVLALAAFTPAGGFVDDRFRFVMTDQCGNQSEGQITVRIEASYTRFASIFEYLDIPAGPNHGRSAWHLDYRPALPLSTPPDGSRAFYGLNYPWTGPDQDSTYIPGYTDFNSNWLVGEPPSPVWPDGFID
jgi:VCBS repeat-containing protein